MLSFISFFLLHRPYFSISLFVHFTILISLIYLIYSLGGPFITQTYDYNAPLDEYGLFNEPKYTHLNQIHSLVKKYSQVILNNNVDPGRMLKKDVYVNVYGRIGMHIIMNICLLSIFLSSSPYF